MRHATRFDILQSRAPSGSVIRRQTNKITRIWSGGQNKIYYNKSAYEALRHKTEIERIEVDEYATYPELIPSRRPKGYRRLAVPHPNTIRAIMRRFPNVNKEQALMIAYWRVISDIRSY